MTVPSGINRYQDLISEIPQGNMYDPEGDLIPFQSEPTYLRFETGNVATQYRIYVNDVVIGLFTTDANGDIIFSAYLPQGEVQIILENLVTGSLVRGYVTVRKTSDWLAAIASGIEALDENIYTVKTARLLAQSESILDVKEIFGNRLNSAGDLGYSFATYRAFLEEYYLAYRLFATKQRGWDHVVGSITQVPPLAFERRKFAKRWIAGYDYLSNRDLGIRSKGFTPFVPAITGVTIDSVGDSNNNGNGSLSWVLASQSLCWTPPMGVIGPAVPVGAGGSFTLHGASDPAMITSLPEPYALNGFAGNAFIALDIDSRGIIYIDLGNAAAETAANVVLAINAALIADVRYGAPFAAFAAVLAYAGNNYVRFIDTIPTTPETSLIVFTSTPGGGGPPVPDDNNACKEIFDVDIKHPSNAVNVTGVSTVEVTMDTPTGATGILHYTFVGQFLAWQEPGAGGPGVPVAVGAGGVFVLNGLAAGSLTVEVKAPRLPIANTTDTISVTTSPYRVAGNLGIETLDVTVDATLLPVGAAGPDVVAVVGSDIPDQWITTGAWTVVHTNYGWLHPYRTSILQAGAGLNFMYKRLDAEAERCEGFYFDVGAWITNSILGAAFNAFLGWSLDGGVSWTWSGAKVIAADPRREPQFIMERFYYEPETEVPMVAVLLDIGAGGAAIIEGVRAFQENVDAMFTGQNMIPRTDHRMWQGHMLYCWASEVLTADENTHLGIYIPPAMIQGHIDTVASAHIDIDRWDISEYSAGAPLNIKGPITEAQWNAGTLTNLEIQVLTPDRFCYLKPSIISQVDGEAMTFDPVFQTAPLSLVSDQVQATARLYEDGIPLPNDEWQFNSGVQIQITGTFTPAATYTFDYQALHQYESAGIDLGATYADYLWFVDWMHHSRFEANETTLLKQVQLIFSAQQLRARLLQPSDEDKSVAVLEQQVGATTTVIPNQFWRFYDAYTIEIDPTFFTVEASYLLTHNERMVLNQEVPTITVEIRKAINQGALAGAVYYTVARNTRIETIVNNYDWVQFRVTVAGIEDVRDFRLRSLIFKGLNMYGAGGTVPGLKP